MSQPKRRSLPAKLTRPQARTLVPRERVFAMLDNPDARTIWITAPAGAGKTSLASSWIQARGLTCLWVQLDAGDADPATLFHYLTLAGLQRAGPKDLLLLPLTPEFLPGMAVYARRFFEHLLGLYPEPFAVVLDNCHEVPADVDVEAFRRLAGRVRTSRSTAIGSASEVERLTRELLAVYPGHFLPGEDRPWAVGIREQLRTRFVRLAADLSVRLERNGAHDTAIELNRHGIELDPLAETFHRGLIRALQARGQKAEALEAFRRCRVLLRKGLNVEPSAETLALYARIH